MIDLRRWTGGNGGVRGTAGAGRTGNRRHLGWVAAGAAGVLLAGCGGGGSGDTAAALAQAQVKAALPDTAAMPGWKSVEQPSAVAMSDLAASSICPNKGHKGCEQSRFLGSVSFKREDGYAEARFWMVAYADKKAADAAYEVLWKDTARRAGREETDLGALGQERDARSGPTGYAGTHEVTAQIRVGTAVLWMGGTARSAKELSPELTKDLAAVFAERVQQAQNGDRPSAALPSA